MQPQVLAKGARAQVEVLADERLDLRAADLLGPERLDHHRHRMRDADRVGDLDLAALGQAGGDDVLGDVARRVRRGAVDLRRVLAAEGAAAVAGHAAVGVDDDLAAREAGVADRAADDEPPRRIHQHAPAQAALVVEVLRQHRLDHVLPQIVGQQRLGAFAVLGGDQQLLDRHRLAVAVAHRHLRLAVRPQVRDHVGMPDLREALRELVRERDRQGHQLRRLLRRVAEHHALVARAGDIELVIVGRVGAALVGGVDALGDVGGLLVDRVDHRARIRAEPEVGVRVADPPDRVPRDVLDVDVRGGRDLTRHDHEPGVHQRLARDTAHRVIAHHRVQNPIGDLIGDLVRMTLGHRLGREQVLVVVELGH